MERKGIITFQGNPLTLLGLELRLNTKAPDFNVLNQALSPVTLADFPNKIKVISVTPSLDTPVCDLQIRRFNQEASSLSQNVVVLNISMDLPFALARFCTTNGIDRVQALSDHRDASFGMNYGVLIKELRLLARAIFVLDKNDTLIYQQIVPELTHEPDYAQAIAAIKGA
ncbi:MAG: thiol peroxidase [Dissulfuribacterales bacterium]